MARLNSFSLLAIALALSNLVIASPLVLRRQTVTVPGNVASGTDTTGCQMFHTVAPGETCLSLEQEFSITDAVFRTLNPEINAACSNLIAGEAYCVQNTPVTPPPNVAPGTITAGCTQFFTVQPGQTCATIEMMFSTSTIAAFRALNPEVNAQCTNLIAGEAYCVQSTSTP